MVVCDTVSGLLELSEVRKVIRGGQTLPFDVILVNTGLSCLGFFFFLNCFSGKMLESTLNYVRDVRILGKA